MIQKQPSNWEMNNDMAPGSEKMKMVDGSAPGTFIS